MNRKTVLLITGVALMLSLFVACGNGAVKSSSPASEPAASASIASTPESALAASEERTFTLEELATFDGKNGQPAYVAVDGIVYDVTNVPEWAGGEHMGGITAGQDLTEEIKDISPHGLRVLEDLPIVGRLA